MPNKTIRLSVTSTGMDKAIDGMTTLADKRDDLPDTQKISIVVTLGAIRGARRTLGIPPRDRGISE